MEHMVVSATTGLGEGSVARVITMNSAVKRGELIKHLEEALAIADELEDGATGYLIETALDEARAQQFRLPTPS